MSMGVHPLNKAWIILISMIGLLFLIGTLYLFDKRNIQKASMLFELETHTMSWDQRGYDGLLLIGEEFDADVYVKEHVQTENEITAAVETLTSQDVHLVIGHGYFYGRYFTEIAASYPNTHFIYYNGGYSADNVTSIGFDSHAMGFFGGMVAGKMTETGEIGIIAAYEWQPEVEGFYEGVKFQNPDATVHINFINDWNANEVAINIYEQMKDNGVDVFYPSGDAFSNDIVKLVDGDGLYAIGYVEDQAAVDDRTVLTSTIQHIDQLYLLATELYQKNKLEGGVMMFDFADDVISLGPFSPDVPEEYTRYIMDLIEQYKETGLLPNEQEKD